MRLELLWNSKIIAVSIVKVKQMKRICEAVLANAIDNIWEAWAVCGKNRTYGSEERKKE